MATIIDALVVTLGLDGSRFDKGRKDAERALTDTGKQATRTAAQLESLGKQGAQFFKLMNEAALLLGVTLTATGIKTLIGDSMNLAASMGRTAHNIGMSTAALSAWSLAAEKAVHASPDAVGGSLSGFSQQFEAFRTKGTPFAGLGVLNSMGVDVTDKVTGAVRPFEEILGDIADRFSKMTGPQATLRGNDLGFDPGLTNFLELGRERVEKELAEAQRRGVVDQKTSEAAQAAQAALTGLEQDFRAVGMLLMIELAPQITAFAHILEDVIQWLEGKKNFEDIGNSLPGGGGPGGTVTTAADGGMSADQAAVQQQMASHALANGWSADDAAVFIGNAMQESSLDPKAQTGEHHGLFQWSKERRDEIKAGTGIDIDTADVEHQMQALDWELAHKYQGVGTAMKAAGDLAGKNKPFSRIFEAPAVGTEMDAEEAHRLKLSSNARAGMTVTAPEPKNGVVPDVEAGHGTALGRFVYRHFSRWRGVDNLAHGYTPDGTPLGKYLFGPPPGAAPQQTPPPETDSVGIGVPEPGQPAPRGDDMASVLRRLRNTPPVDRALGPQSMLGSGVGSMQHSETHIGSITVNTRASDPVAVAEAVRSSYRRPSIGADANVGLS